MTLPLDTIICGDALAVLKTLPSDSVDCCVTSPPPYYAIIRGWKDGMNMDASSVVAITGRIGHSGTRTTCGLSMLKRRGTIYFTPSLHLLAPCR